MREALSVANSGLAVSAGGAARRLEISYASSASAGPPTGRVFATMERTVAARGGDREPRRGMQDWMNTTHNPHYEDYFMYGAIKGRCYAER
jgi:hypothetical protein